MGAIAENEADIAENEADIEDLKSDFAENESAIAENDADIEDLKSDFAENDADISDLKSDFEEMKRLLEDIDGDTAQDTTIANADVAPAKFEIAQEVNIDLDLGVGDLDNDSFSDGFFEIFDYFEWEHYALAAFVSVLLAAVGMFIKCPMSRNQSSPLGVGILPF